MWEGKRGNGKKKIRERDGRERDRIWKEARFIETWER